MPRSFDVMVTAQEAFPKLEAAFLDAQEEIVAGFRIFDPLTRLHSDVARRFGDRWFDLLVHTLNRGVRIHMTLTDFDPVVRMGEHRYAWACYRAFIAAGEASDQPENLHVTVAMHPARVGLIPRIALWVRSIKEINAQIARLTSRLDLSDEILLQTTPLLRDLARKRAGRLRAKMFPPPPLVPVTHHQKLAVFDGTRLYIGGLDVNDRRYDTKKHARASHQTWHDVQVLVEGDIAAEARTHLLTLEDAVNGTAAPRPVHLLRTLSKKRRIALPFLSPLPIVDELAAAHHNAVNRAEKLIYLETQFFREQALADALARRADKAPELTLIMMLPAAPEDIAFSDEWGPDAAFGEHLQVNCIETIQEAFGDRLFIGSPAQPRPSDGGGRAVHYDAPIIYLHAKLSIFDDQFGIVSSANLNGRSLRWDTEAGVSTETPAEATLLKDRCFRHWLGKGIGDEFFDTATARDAWSQRASQNAARDPAQRLGFVLPYALAPARTDARPLPGVPAEMA